MEELFRLKIADDGQTTVPQRLMNVLQLDEGDEIQITTDEGRIVKTEPHKSHTSKLARPGSGEEFRKRVERIRKGDHDDQERLSRRLGKSRAKVATNCGRGA